MDRVQYGWLKGLVLVFAFFWFAPTLRAQTKAKVLRTKGNKAIIRIDSGDRLERGDRLDIELSGISSFESVSAGPGGRGHFVGGEFSYTQSSTTTSRDNVPDEEDENTTLVLGALYGWNKKKYEYGAELDYTSVSEEGDTVSSLALGGFFEYNFKDPNAKGNKLVPAVGTSLALRNANLGSASGDGFLISVYLGGKYFALAPTLAFTGFLELERDSVSYSTGRQDVSLNTRIVLGLRQYL